MATSPRKPQGAKAFKRGRELLRAIEHMSDAANAQNVAEARPSTEAMIREARKLLQSSTQRTREAERQALHRMISAGAEILASLGVDQARGDAAAVKLRDALNDLMPLLGGNNV